MRNLWLLLCLLAVFRFEAAQSGEINTEFPAELSFLVVDFKYNGREGVKICEVQHGTLSKFRGDYALYGNPGEIAGNFCRFLYEHQSDNVWYIDGDINEPNIKEEMQNYHWKGKTCVEDLFADEEFLVRACSPLDNPISVDSYHGFLYMRPKSYFQLKKKMPALSGILVLDVATFPYWIDKSKVNDLFSGNPVLSNYKPRCKTYKKKYTKALAKKIMHDLSCKQYVIKPIGGFHGNGVIIVDANELDKTLYKILKKAKKLRNHPDPSYRYWYRDVRHVFTVEEFIPSDPIVAPHLGGSTYDPTMRVGYVAYYHENAIHIELLGSYWKLPSKSLEQTGSLTEKHKSDGGFPYVMKVSEEEMEMIRPELINALTLLYQQMLERKT